MRAALLLLLGASIAAVPSSALALTNAERKAMDAKSIDAASTRKSGFAEIRFGGPIGERLGRGDLRNGKVKVRFIPASGKATTITESGPSGAPTTRRRGTKGEFDVARDGRRLLVFAKNLRAPAARVVVTTKGPPKLDTLRAQPPFLDLESELELELEQTDRAGVATQTRLTNAELKVADTSAKVKRLERALNRANNRAQARKVRKKLARQRAKLARQKKLQSRAAARLGTLDRVARGGRGGPARPSDTPVRRPRRQRSGTRSSTSASTRTRAASCSSTTTRWTSRCRSPARARAGAQA